MLIKIIVVGLLAFMIYNLIRALFIMNKNDPEQTTDVEIYWSTCHDLCCDHSVITDWRC